MSKHLTLWSAIVLGSAAMLGLNSCDPYYYSGSYSSGYSGSYSNSYPVGYGSGYGSGFGYGSPSFTTSFFVSTGSPVWGYDPYCRSYYNYQRRCYYDPYLYGYYPRGYRPPILVGVPHPRGYRSNYCPPPVRITNVTLNNYDQRARRYGSLQQPWSREVRMHDYRQGRSSAAPRGYDNRQQVPYGTMDSGSRRSVTPQRPSWLGEGNRNQYTPEPGMQPDVSRRSSRSTGLPSHYNQPVIQAPTPGRSQDMRTRRSAITPQQAPHFQPQSPPQARPQAPAPQPVQPQAPPQIERRMPERMDRETPRMPDRPMPDRAARPAPEPRQSPPSAPAPTANRPQRQPGLDARSHRVRTTRG